MRITTRNVSILLFFFLASAGAAAANAGAASATASTAQAPPRDLTGFGPTKWGMTRQEVLAVLPSGARPARNGETGDLVLEDVPIGDGLYEARFFVGPHGLERVFVTAARQDATPARRRRLQRALSAELGGGSLVSRRPENVDVRWVFPSTDVHLLYSRLSTPDVRWQGLFVVYSRGSGRPVWPDSFEAVAR